MGTVTCRPLSGLWFRRPTLAKVYGHVLYGPTVGQGTLGGYCSYVLHKVYTYTQRLVPGREALLSGLRKDLAVDSHSPPDWEHFSSGGKLSQACIPRWVRTLARPVRWYRRAAIIVNLSHVAPHPTCPFSFPARTSHLYYYPGG